MRYDLRKVLRKNVISPGGNRKKLSVQELRAFYSQHLTEGINLYQIYIDQNLEDMLFGVFGGAL